MMRYPGLLLFHVCGGAVHRPVTSHQPSGEAGIAMEARPPQWRFTSGFNVAVANKGPSQLPVDRDDWEQRKVARFSLRRSPLLRCWHSIAVLGYRQHNFLGDATDKNLTAPGSHGRLHPGRWLGAHLQQRLQ